MNEDDIIKDEDDLELKLPPDIEKSGDVLDEEPESIDKLVEEEEEEDDEEPFDDVNPI